MNDDMRGLFFVVKGQYSKGSEPSVVNKVSNDINYIGGYDPYEEDTVEWYQLKDNITFTTMCCGSDLDSVLRGVYTTIKHFKGSVKKYLRHLKDSDTLNSKVMTEMWKSVYEEYGDYYSDEVKEMEDLAYEELKEEKPVFKNKKLVSKVKSIEVETPQEEKVIETPTLKKVKPKVKLGIKKLNMV